MISLPGPVDITQAGSMLGSRTAFPLLRADKTAEARARLHTPCASSTPAPAAQHSRVKQPWGSCFSPGGGCSLPCSVWHGGSGWLSE